MIIELATTSWSHLRQSYFGRMDGFRVHVRTIRDAADKRSALLTLKSSRRGLVREEHEIGLDMIWQNCYLACFRHVKLFVKRDTTFAIAMDCCSRLIASKVQIGTGDRRGRTLRSDAGSWLAYMGWRGDHIR